jgi:Tol biopolymer transport system component
VDIRDPRTGSTDIWLYDVAGNVRTRFTFDPANDECPIWSPDGTRIIFSSSRRGHLDLYEKPLAGLESETLLLETDVAKYATDWSPDGRYLLYESGDDLWILPLFGDRRPRPFLQTGAAESNAKFSPDGRWVAYDSDESGQEEVYVTPFPEPGRKWQVSRDGGFYPGWWGTSGRMTYGDLEGMLVSLHVRVEGSSVRIGPQTRLFSVLDALGGTDHPTSDRLLIVRPLRSERSDRLSLVVNWPAETRRK